MIPGARGFTGPCHRRLESRQAAQSRGRALDFSHQDSATHPRKLEHAALPPRVRSVLARVLSDVTSVLGAPLAQALHEAQLALRNAVPRGDRHAHEEHAASLEALRTGAPGITSRFMAQLEASLAGIRAPAKAAESRPANTGELSLSLLDDEAAADEAMLEATASRAEVRNSLALQLLAHRLGVLAARPVFEMEDMPLGPHLLTRAFVEAIAPLPLNRQAHARLFEQFDVHVMAAYPPLVDVINATLAGLGILPHLSFIPIRPRPAQRREPSPTRDGREGDAVKTATAAEGAGPLAGGIVPGSRWPLPRTSGGADDARFQVLQDLLRNRRQLLAKLRPSHQGAPQPAMPSEAVSQSLRSLRGLPEPIATVEQARVALLERAQQSTGHGMSLAQADLDTFELLGLFLDYLQRELRTGSPGDQLIGRLRLPLLQLALRDHRFFVDADHPARQLLNAFSLAGARWLGADDLSPQWLAHLQQAIATVELDAEAEPATFTKANQQLQERLQPLYRNFDLSERRQVEAARGREKLALARIQASELIADHIGDRVLPKFESVLLSQAWTDVLALGHLRHVEGSEAWDKLMQATRRIVDRAAGDEVDIPDPALFGLVAQSLEQVGYHRADAQAIAAQLTGFPCEEVDMTSRTGLLVQLRARARLGEGVAPDTPTAPLTEEAQAAFDRMKRPGARLWVEHEESPGQWVRRRLGWTSARTGQTLLLNRRGQRVPSEDLPTLAQAVAEGRALLMSEDVAPAEAAWRAMNASLQRLASGAERTPTETGHGN